MRINTGISLISNMGYQVARASITWMLTGVTLVVALLDIFMPPVDLPFWAYAILAIVSVAAGLVSVKFRPTESGGVPRVGIEMEDSEFILDGTIIENQDKAIVAPGSKMYGRDLHIK